MNAYIETPLSIFEYAAEQASLEPIIDDGYRVGDLIWEAGRKGAIRSVDGVELWEVFKEAMMGDYPRNFFDFLFANDVLHIAFPEVYRMRGAIESQKWHPEGNAYEHTMLVLQRAADHGFDLETRIACLVHDFGKALTPIEEMPRHHGHDERGMQPATDFLYRFGTLEADNLARPMRLMCKYHMRMHDIKNLRNVTLVRMFNSLGSGGSVQILKRLAACDSQGRLGSHNEDVSYLNEYDAAFEAYSSVNPSEVWNGMDKNRNELDLRRKVDELRAYAIGAVRGKTK